MSTHTSQSFVFTFFFTDPAPTEIYTLSLHDALPIYHRAERQVAAGRQPPGRAGVGARPGRGVADPRGRGGEGIRRNPDRKSTRLNSSHGYISYAVFCLKKKKQTISRQCSGRAVTAAS